MCLRLNPDGCFASGYRRPRALPSIAPITQACLNRIVAITGHYAFGEAEGASCFNEFMLKRISFSELEALLQP